MKIENLALNQVVVTIENKRVFSSYGTTIAEKNEKGTFLDEKYYNYSKTTSKYLYQFLGISSKKEVEKGIKNGLYILTNLN